MHAKASSSLSSDNSDVTLSQVGDSDVNLPVSVDNSDSVDGLSVESEPSSSESLQALDGSVDGSSDGSSDLPDSAGSSSNDSVDVNSLSSDSSDSLSELSVVSGDVMDLLVVNQDSVGVSDVTVDSSVVGVESSDDFPVLGGESSVSSDGSQVLESVGSVASLGVGVDDGDSGSVGSSVSSKSGLMSSSESSQVALVSSVVVLQESSVSADGRSSGLVVPDSESGDGGVVDSDGESSLSSVPSHELGLSSGKVGESSALHGPSSLSGSSVAGPQVKEVSSVGGDSGLSDPVVVSSGLGNSSAVVSSGGGHSSSVVSDGNLDVSGSDGVDLSPLGSEMVSGKDKSLVGGDLKSSSVESGSVDPGSELGEPLLEGSGSASELLLSGGDLSSQDTESDSVSSGPGGDLLPDVGAQFSVVTGDSGSQGGDLGSEKFVRDGQPAAPLGLELSDGNQVPSSSALKGGLSVLNGKGKSLGVDLGDLSSGGGSGLDKGGSQQSVGSVGVSDQSGSVGSGLSDRSLVLPPVDFLAPGEFHSVVVDPGSDHDSHVSDALVESGSQGGQVSLGDSLGVADGVHVAPHLGHIVVPMLPEGGEFLAHVSEVVLLDGIRPLGLSLGLRGGSASDGNQCEQQDEGCSHGNDIRSRPCLNTLTVCYGLR
jgi:hypothetical protein